MIDTPHSLLQRLRRPDDGAAWEKFVALYTPLFERWAKRLGHSQHDTADLVQETLLVVVKALPDFEHRGPGSFRAWLRTILRNRWIDWARKSTPLAGSGLAAIADPNPDSVLVFEDEEYRTELAERMLRLIQDEFEPTTWQAFLMFAVGGKPAAEVASELGLSANAVYLGKARILRRLREELGEFWD
jgi:RNA polymerase sigma-70 factor (ECF subfamily)